MPFVQGMSRQVEPLAPPTPLADPAPHPLLHAIAEVRSEALLVI